MLSALAYGLLVIVALALDVTARLRTRAAAAAEAVAAATRTTPGRRRLPELALGGRPLSSPGERGAP